MLAEPISIADLTEHEINSRISEIQAEMGREMPELVFESLNDELNMLIQARNGFHMEENY